MREILTYIRSDYCRYRISAGGRVPLWRLVLYALSGRNRCFTYSFWLRLSSRRNLLYLPARLMHSRLSRKYGIQIPPATRIGYGLYLGHGMSIVVNPTAVIGNNCNLSQFTTIGSNEGHAAVIGDNVYIGPSVCIVENVRIGDNATIGAGAVVTRDIPAGATAAGVPARVLNFDRPGRYVGNRYVPAAPVAEP